MPKVSEKKSFSRWSTSDIYMRWDAMIVSFMAAFVCFSLCSAGWLSNDDLALLTQGIRPSIPTGAFLFSLLWSVFVFFAVYVLAFRVTDGLHRRLKGALFSRGMPVRWSNLARNWYFPLSAIFFYWFNDIFTIEYRAGAVFAVFAAAVIAGQIPSLLELARQSSRKLCVLSLLSALGICWEGIHTFQANWYSFIILPLQHMIPLDLNISMLVCVSGAGAAVFFVFFMVLAFWKAIAGIMCDNDIFGDIKGIELLLYGALFLLGSIYIISVFRRTDAFYGTPFFYDIIYTSDSPFLIKESVYLTLSHLENDIRQPLFAVFSAPFIGIAYLIGELCGGSATTIAIVTDIAQTAVLLAANFILAKMLHLTGMKRMCFMVLLSFTYTQLLFVLMMEQYIMAYFWLMLCLLLISEKNQPDRMTVWATGGTLLTGLILLPFLSKNQPHKHFKEWFLDMVTFGLEFAALLFVLARFNVVWSVISRLLYLGDFSGRGMTVPDRINQYTEFIKNCFVAPNAHIQLIDIAPPSWKQLPVTEINYIGVVIFLCVMLSFVLNRHKKSSRIAMGWIVFSIAILIGFGWGTQENGLILYALYFGWAYFALLFQLAEWAENKLHTKVLLPAVTIGALIAFAAMNIPAMMEIIRFGITYYPI